MKTRIAPVRRYPSGIPWSLHLRACNAYSTNFDQDQSAELIAERGGFDCYELDLYIPGWREEVSGESLAEFEKAEIKLGEIRKNVQEGMELSGGEMVGERLAGNAIKEEFRKGELSAYIQIWDCINRKEDG